MSSGILSFNGDLNEEEDYFGMKMHIPHTKPECQDRECNRGSNFHGESVLSLGWIKPCLPST